MAAVKQVQIIVMGDRDYPLFSAKGVADAGFEGVFRSLAALNPTITAEQAIHAVWEEGVRAVQAKVKQRKLPGRLATLKIVAAPTPKANPRPIK